MTHGEDPSLAAEAGDPTTELQRLAQLAYEHPQTRPLVAMNPSTYDGLLEWLEANGDQATLDALARRANPALTPPPPPPPHEPAGTTVTQGSPLRRGAVLGIAGGVLAVTAVAVAAILVIPQLFASPNGTPPIRVAELGSAPSMSWSLVNPLAAAAPEEAYLVVDGMTVAQDEALLVWTGDSDEVELDDIESKLSLIDTKTGATKWEVPWGYSSADVLSPPGTEFVLLSTYDGDSTVFVSVNRSTGEIASTSTAWMEVLSSSPLLDGDLIVKIGDTLGRYAIDDLKEPLWTVALEEGVRAGSGGGVVISGSDVYSIIDGSKVGWTANSEAAYGEISGLLFTENTSGGLTRVDESTGAGIWTYNGDPQQLFIVPDSTVLISADVQAGTMTATDMEDGTERWTIDAVVTPDAGGFNTSGISATGGVVWLPISENRSFATAVDLATGERLYEVQVSEDGDWWRSIIAMTETTVYLSGGQDSELQAIDARTGTIRWTMESPYSNWYTYDVWGGNFVAFRSDVGSPQDDLDHPQVMGLSS